MASKEGLFDNINPAWLDQPCREKHLSEISDSILEWEELTPHLDLTDVEVEDIKETNSTLKLRRRAMLKVWKQKKGKKATYRKLANILASRDCRKVAETVCKMVKDSGKHNGENNKKTRAGGQLLPDHLPGVSQAKLFSHIRAALRKQSNGSDATYRSLISAFAGHKDFAETVHDIASKHHKLWLYNEDENSLKRLNCLDQVLDFDNCGVQRDLGQIADSMNEWEGSISEQLDLSLADVAAIKTKYPMDLKLQIRAALHKWKQSKGSYATYRNLISAFKSASRKDFAETVHDIAMTHSSQPDIKCRSKVALSKESPAVKSSPGSSTCFTHDDEVEQPLVGPASSHIELYTQQGQQISPVPSLASLSLTLDNCPTLKLLSLLKTAEGKKIKIIPTVASQWQSLGDQLDFDRSGKKLQEIKEINQGDPKECCRSMFQHWINGNGVQPRSWRKLIEVLDDCEFEELAAEVQSVCSYSVR